MRKTSLQKCLLAASFSMAMAFPAYADTVVAAAPGTAVEVSIAPAQTDENGYAVVSGSSIYGNSSYTVIGPSSSESSSQNQSPSDSDGSSTSIVGANYANDPVVSVDLGFTLVSPNHEQGGFKVAEGSVQLSDGSWVTIDYDQYIRGRYYMLLREETDSTGTGWYVVKASATQIGDYTTSDGTVVNELWLKKSDCVTTDSIQLNTSNSTRQNIVKTALSLLGLSYEYAGNGPDSFDCSGFVNYVMSANGISVPRTSEEICNTGTQVGIEDLRPGDIVGRVGHVGIYIGDGYFVHSSDSATGVITENVDVYNSLQPFTNYVSVVE